MRLKHPVARYFEQLSAPPKKKSHGFDSTSFQLPFRSHLRNGNYQTAEYCGMVTLVYSSRNLPFARGLRASFGEYINTVLKPLPPPSILNIYPVCDSSHRGTDIPARDSTG